MKIGIIGIGTLTLEMAIRSARAGYEIIVHNPRGNSLVREATAKMGSNASLGSLEEAAAAEVILLFLPKDDLENVITSLPDMSGKIIVHTSSLIFDPGSLLSGIAHAMTYKITASLLPEAHIVKLFTPLNLKAENKCTEQKNQQELFFIAHHGPSKNSMRNFLKKLNFLPIDLSGRLHLQSGAMELKPILTRAASPFADKPN